MISTESAPIRIQSLLLREGENERALKARRELYDLLSSDVAKNTLMERWRRLPVSIDKIIEASTICMLFPEVREEMNLGVEDIETIKDPPKRYYGTTATPQEDPLDTLMLIAAGRILFPNELAGWKLDRATYIPYLNQIVKRLEGNLPRMQYRYAVAVSEAILSKELMGVEVGDREFSTEFESELERNVHNYVGSTSSAIPGFARLLKPTQYRDISFSAEIWQNAINRHKAEFAFHDTPSDLLGDMVLYGLAMAAGEVHIDEHGIHFTPPPESVVISSAKLPLLRHF